MVSIGGFTFLPDKAKRPLPKVPEQLPDWMLSPITFPDDLNQKVALSECSLLLKKLCKRLTKMGYTDLFPVQHCTFSWMLQPWDSRVRPKDLCLRAATGSGKTLAYAVPIVQHLLQHSGELMNKCVQALVILPTRELAHQVFSVFMQLTWKTGLQVALINGQNTLEKEQNILTTEDSESLYCSQDIVVCTPGRLTEHIRLTDSFILDALRFLVLDEADEMMQRDKYHWFVALDQELYHDNNGQSLWKDEEHSAVSGKRLRPRTSLEHCLLRENEIPLQKILVSATLTVDPEAIVKFNLFFPTLITSIANVPTKPSSKSVQTQQTPTAENGKVSKAVHSAGVASKETIKEELNFKLPESLKTLYVCVKSEWRPLFMLRLLHMAEYRDGGGIVCFVNGRERTHNLCDLLTDTLQRLQKSTGRQETLTAVRAISAQLPIQKRNRVLEKFCAGDIKMLICSDGMSRGIDFPNTVRCVVSYDRPCDLKTYVHRVGRTARAGQEGYAYTLLDNNQVRHFRSMVKPLRVQCKEKLFPMKQMKPYMAAFMASRKAISVKVVKKSSPDTAEEVVEGNEDHEKMEVT